MSDTTRQLMLRIGALCMVLVSCRDKFREYEALHLAKGTPDGDEKAARNRIMAEACDLAISGAAPLPVSTPALDKAQAVKSVNTDRDEQQ